MTLIPQELLGRVAGGEDEAAFLELVAALQADGGAAPQVLLNLLDDPAPGVRRAAVHAARGRAEAELLTALAEVVHDASSLVRQELAAGLAETPTWPVPDGVLENLLHDGDADVRLAAVQAARWRPGLAGILVDRLGQDDYWRVRQRLAEVLAFAPARLAVPPLLHRLGADGDADVQRASAVTLEKHLTALGGYPDDLARPPVAVLEEARKRLTTLSGYYPVLTGWIDDRVSREVNTDTVKNFGTLLTAEAEAGRLPRAYGVDRYCTALQAILTGQPPRAAVLIGEPGCGKTAITHELTHRLLKAPDGPWHVLRVSPAEFLVGTRYIGEWETKVHSLIQAVKAPRKVVLVVPNLEELSEVGTTSKSDHNVGTALSPFIERGEIIIIGESTPEAFRSGLGAVGQLRRLFHSVEVPAAGPRETRAILQKVRDEGQANVPDPVLDRLVELADYYLAGTAQPGRTVGLLRRVLDGTKERPGPVTPRDVLTTLSTSTGIPVDFLDDAIPLDRAQIRGFFEQRVMGQPEAVEAVIDLVTLVKAGLTDPGKPFGILFFVGPTGVGKTELARALAELLFGDPGRLTRFDMSEYATYEAYERLIGFGTRPGHLTSVVRERPFSVLLFDEIEKAHPNVFDLCLQVFDAGRLTDAQGRASDFRRSIIILTSNIGSRVEETAGLGFGTRTSGPTLPDRDEVLRELGRVFRPEFLNRLDRIVTFRPLDTATAAQIARREVARVLERSGIARRRLAVDVDPGVLALLLKEGYSLAFGARPLKRTVERLVLLPAARAITAATVPPGSVLHLAARNGTVEVQVTPAEPDAQEADARPTDTGPLPDRGGRLRQRVAALQAQAATLAARKAELLARSVAPGFWEQRLAAQAAFDEVYRIDGALAALDEVVKAARPDAAPEAEDDGATPQLEWQLRHVARLLSCRDGKDLADAYLTVTLVGRHGRALDGINRLARMYLCWAKRWGLKVEVLDDRQGGDPPEDTVTLLVTGVGAYALLAGEAGLHQLARKGAKTEDGAERPVDRDTVRVEVLPAPAVDEPLDEVKITQHPLPERRGRLISRLKTEVQLFHPPSLLAVRAWTGATRAKAVEQLRPLLRARLTASQAAAGVAAGKPRLVRRYHLGPVPLVRDLRSGQTTRRLDQVFKGHLELFLEPPAEGGGA